MDQDPIVIVAAKRTPLGAFHGDLSGLTAPQMGASAIRGALDSISLAAEDVSELLMGCVLPAGIGQAPARQAGLGGGLPAHVPATTVNKVCGSGMKTVMLAHDQIQMGHADIVVAGGMESMSNAPYLLDKVRTGLRIGHGHVIDHMYLDGLEDAYDRGRLMGDYAEDIAEALQLTRAAQDAYAVRSVERARRAAVDGDFHREIVAVEAGARISADEGPDRVKPEKVSGLKPAFRPGGTVTAATSASIADGAAALVLMRLSDADRRGITPLAKISGHTSFAQRPSQFTTSPIFAIGKLLERVGWRKADVDLYEINEAFAVVPMAAMQQLDIPADKVNVNGGACVLGHPLGASGARILVTLLSAMETRDVRRGIASLCIGGGEATAMAVERL